MMTREDILKECLDQLKKSDYKGIILLPTGTGKGRLMVEVIKILKPKSVLYLCDNQNLRDEMFKTEVYKWGGSEYIDVIDYACYQSAYKWQDKYYDLVLADEFDASLTPSYSKVYDNIKSKYHVYVSATLDPVKRRHAEKISTIIYEKVLSEIVGTVLNNVTYYIVDYDLTERENERYLDFNKQFKILLNDTVKDTAKINYLKIARKQFLSNLTNSVAATKWITSSTTKREGNTLVFCGSVKQANKISKYTYHSKNPDKTILENYNKGLIKELAVVEKITRGVNLNNVRYIIHNTVGTSNTKLTQKTGRGMRLDKNDTLSVFFMRPNFRSPFHGKKPTIVDSWIKNYFTTNNITTYKTISYKT